MTATERNDAAAVAACDPRALSVAQAVHERLWCQATILFGSRARGDYEEGRSDIDIMLLNPGMPDQGYKDRASQWAEGLAQSTYGHPVPVQLVWRTLDDFRHNRRYVNSVETDAVRDGVVMSQDSNQRDPSYYDGTETESEYDWSPYNERMRHAEIRLDEFIDTAERGRNDLIIGQHAQAALEHSMKALLEAHGAPYRRTHNIGELLGNIRHRDPELSSFRLSIPAEVYTTYSGGDEYEVRTQPSLTEFPEYLERTKADVEHIINRAREVRQRRDD